MLFTAEFWSGVATTLTLVSFAVGITSYVYNKSKRIVVQKSRNTLLREFNFELLKATYEIGGKEVKKIVRELFLLENMNNNAITQNDIVDNFVFDLPNSKALIIDYKFIEGDNLVVPKFEISGSRLRLIDLKLHNSEGFILEIIHGSDETINFSGSTKNQRKFTNNYIRSEKNFMIHFMIFLFTIGPLLMILIFSRSPKFRNLDNIFAANLFDLIFNFLFVILVSFTFTSLYFLLKSFFAKKFGSNVYRKFMLEAEKN